MNSIMSIITRGLSKTLVVSVIAGLSLSACNEKDVVIAQTPSQASPRVAFSDANTQADCLKLRLDTEAQIMNCMKAVSDRNSHTRQIKLNDLDQALKDEKEIGAKLETTIDGLSKVVAIQEGKKDRTTHRV